MTDLLGKHTELDPDPEERDLQWDYSFGDGSSDSGVTDHDDNDHTISHTYTTAGAYTVSVTVSRKEASGPPQFTCGPVTCKVTAFQVEITTPSSFPVEVCADSDLSLGSTVTPASALGGTFTWSKDSGPGTVTFSPSANAEDPSFSVDTVGNYTVTVEYTKDDSTCIDTSGTIRVIQVNSVTTSKDVYATNEDVVFTVHTTPTGYYDLISWSGGGIPATQSGGETFTTKWSTKGTYTVTASCGNSSAGKTVEIIVNLTVMPREAIVPVGDDTKDFEAWSVSNGVSTNVTAQSTFSTNNESFSGNTLTAGSNSSSSKGSDWVRATYQSETTDNDHDCDLTVIKINTVTVDSGATQTNVTGTKNWAAVKSDGEVTIEASILPNDVQESELPEGAVTWTNANPVSGHPLQATRSKSQSEHKTVTATCGNSSDYVDLWILWSTIEIKMTGTTPANAVQFGFFYDGTENLGAIIWDGGTQANGKVIPIGTITPSNIQNVVKDGWGFEREVWQHTFIDGAKVDDEEHWNTKWEPDTSYPVCQNLEPDSNGKI